MGELPLPLTMAALSRAVSEPLSPGLHRRAVAEVCVCHPRNCEPGRVVPTTTLLCGGMGKGKMSPLTPCYLPQAREPTILLTTYSTQLTGPCSLPVQLSVGYSVGDGVPR